MEYRHEIIRLSEDERLTEREIANRLHIPSSTVHYWLARNGCKAVTKSGRPRVTNANLDTSLYESLLKNPFLSAVDLQRTIANHCSVDTVRNRIKEKGLKCRIPARKPFLKPYHREKRYAFALSHLEWTVDQWHNVIFTDEKIFRSSSRGALRVYRPRRGSDRYDDEYLVSSSNPASVGTPRFTICVWMAFGGRGIIKAIHRIESPTLNANYYTGRILPSIESSIVENDFMFMQDLSSIHTSKLTMNWLTSHNIRIMSDWPPKGPDMNPVENVWAELVRRIEIRRRDGEGVDNRDQLWEDVQTAFDSLPNSYFDRLIESMPKRVQTVVEKHGGWTKY